MNGPVYLYPVGLMGTKRHLAADPEWARNTTSS